MHLGVVRIRSVLITVEGTRLWLTSSSSIFHRQRVFMQTEPYTAVAPYLTSKDTRRRQYYFKLAPISCYVLTCMEAGCPMYADLAWPY